jgi:phenylacetate-CoA ligase
MANNLANFFIAQSWRGAAPYDDIIYIWGAERDIFAGKKPFMASVKDFFGNRLRFNSFKMSEALMIDCINALNKHKPKLIIAYVQSMYELARFAKTNRLHVEKQHAVHAAAGTMYDFLREEIEEVFQCKVFNHYGSREVGAIASECDAHDGLHMMSEHTLVEVVDEEGRACKPGEKGEIVVTTLNNFSMPLIRYKIGDIGVKQAYSPCSCGCSYPKLQEVVGRSTDIFSTKSGIKVYGAYFTHLFYYIDWIKSFQVIQDDFDLINVKIVKAGKEKQESLDEIEAKIKLVMGEDCRVVFHFVDSIPKTKTGKLLYTVSKIA